MKALCKGTHLVTTNLENPLSLGSCIREKESRWGVKLEEFMWDFGTRLLNVYYHYLGFGGGHLDFQILRLRKFEKSK